MAISLKKIGNNLNLIIGKILISIVILTVSLIVINLMNRNLSILKFVFCISQGLVVIRIGILEILKFCSPLNGYFSSSFIVVAGSSNLIHISSYDFRGLVTLHSLNDVSRSK